MKSVEGKESQVTMNFSEIAMSVFDFLVWLFS